MKALTNNRFSNLEVATAFNNIILSKLDGYDGKKKEQLKAFINDMYKGGCQSGMIGEFIYNSDCKDFYIKHIDELEDLKTELEDDLGESIQNRNELPHYTFMCWLCFEEYVYNIGREFFDL